MRDREPNVNPIPPHWELEEIDPCSECDESPCVCPVDPYDTLEEKRMDLGGSSGCAGGTECEP